MRTLEYLLPLMTWELWLARDIVADHPLPWQKSMDKLTPGRVAIGVGWSFSGEKVLQLFHPNLKGLSPGWTPGKRRSRKNRYPTVKKTASKPRKEPQKSA